MISKRVMVMDEHLTSRNLNFVSLKMWKRKSEEARVVAAEVCGSGN